MYHTNRPINRPVLRHRPWWPTDMQSLPPQAWCDQCGAEVYRPHTDLCPRCGIIKN